MIRLFTAAVLATLLASPVLAQSVSPSDPSGSSVQRNQGLPSAPGSSDPMPRAPGTAGPAPNDCAPNDPRPECQTAQLPGQDPSSRAIPDQSGTGLMTPPAQRSEPESSPGQGSPGGMGR